MAKRTLHELAARVESLAGDKDKYLTAPNDYEAAVQAAAFLLSKWKPARRVQTYAGNGSTFNLTAPTYWTPGFSRVLEIVTDWSEGDQTKPEALDESEFLVYLASDGVEKIKLISETPATGETTRIVYTAPHVVDSSAATCTIDSREDEDKVIFAATADCLRTMAAIASANKNSNFSSDSKDENARANTLTSLAEFYEKRSGLFEGLAVSAITLPREDSQGSARLTHR